MQFFQEFYSYIDRNSGEKFENVFLIKIANKGTSLRMVDLRALARDGGLQGFPGLETLA